MISSGMVTVGRRHVTSTHTHASTHTSTHWHRCWNVRKSSTRAAIAWHLLVRICSDQIMNENHQINSPEKKKREWIRVQIIRCSMFRLKDTRRDPGGGQQIHKSTKPKGKERREGIDSCGRRHRRLSTNWSQREREGSGWLSQQRRPRRRRRRR